MTKRIRELFTLLAAAWRLWRESGTPADLEIQEYERAWESRPENVIVLIPPTRATHNALHFRDTRRRMH